MAEAHAAAHAGKGLGATLAKKVGPFPLGVWLAAGVGAVWYLHNKQGKTGPGGTAANGTTQTGYGTDPAGNTGYIDPSTGYVYGSAEDIAALQSQGLVGANSYNTGGTGDTSGTGASGSSMATPPPPPGGTSGGTSAGGSATGTTNASGTSTTTASASGPGTSGGTSTGGGAAPKSNSWRYPAPSGLHATSVSDSGFGLAWNPVTGPNGQHPGSYTVATYQTNGKKVDQFTAHGTSTKEYGAGGKGLHPGWQYRVNVWANGGPQAPSHASIVVTVKPKGAK